MSQRARVWTALSAALMLGLAMAPPAHAQAGATARSVDTASEDVQTSGITTTRHKVTVGGKVLSYTARAGLIPIRDNDAGEVHGSMFFVSYTLDRTPGQAPRPLTFLWNGGPGSNSGLVHLLGFGPKRLAGSKPVVNDGTWIDQTDLVFVDPIGTGYSRPAKPEYAAEFYQSRGDAESVAEFIRVYRTRYDAFDAPLFIAGESYGVTRAALVADALERRGTSLSGVIMIGLALPLGEMTNAQRIALGLPTFTAAAFANRKLAPDLQADLRTALTAAERWASTEYASALARGDTLSAQQREAVAAQLARFTGLPPGRIDRVTLRVQMADYTNALLADDNRVVGRYDSRLVGPRDTTQVQYDPTRDPSLKDILDGTAVLRYLRTEIGYKSDLLYQGPFGGGYPAPTSPRGDWMSVRWNRTIPVDPQALRTAMTTNPRLNVFIACGYYDMVCDYYGNEYAASHLPPALTGRVMARSYGGGHAIYTDDGARLQLKRDVAAFIVARSGAPPGTDVTYEVKPLRPPGGDVSSIEVRAEIRGTLPEGRPFSLQAPITYASVAGIADRVDDLAVRDSAGPVSLTIVDDPVNRGGFPYFRHWRATRRVVTPVVVTYRMRPFSGVPRAGPQFDLYAHGGGVSTGGMALFVVPEGLGTVSARIRWDLKQLAASSLVASTYGEGNLTLAGPIDRIVQAYYMAGPLGRYAPAATSKFRAYWLGQTPFDAASEMAWGYRAYENLRQFHRDTATSGYNVFVRALPSATTIPAGTTVAGATTIAGATSMPGPTASLGGTALQNSFMLAVPAGERDTTKTAPRNTIAHEMGHMWVGAVSGGGQGGTTWFNEGLNVYYTRLLLMRAGLISVEEYGYDVNAGVRAYQINPYRNASADSLDRLGFSAGIGLGGAQNVPYVRGSLFFADIDARIRTASGGARRLDDVLLPLFARRRNGTPLTTTMLIDAFAKEVGPSIRAEFDAIIIRGETISPVPNAFGPCFARRERTDTIAGRVIEGYQWVRVTTVPDVECRAW